MYIHNSLFIFEVEMEKMDSSLIHRSCTFIIVSSYFLSRNGKDGLITNSSFMYILTSLFIFFKLKWKRWTQHSSFMYIHNSLFIFKVEMEKMDMEKMDSSLIHRSCTSCDGLIIIHRSCTFIIVSSYLKSMEKMN